MLAILLPLLAVLAAGCGSSSSKTTPKNTSSTPSSSTSSSSAKGGSVTIKSATIKPYGTVLVNSAGHALYIFFPDHAKKVTCTGTCAGIWPPVKLPTGAKATASGQVMASLLGSDPDPSGGDVVTYDGWPLYAYVTDTTPGVAHGQGLNVDGGLWYLIAPSGKVIKPKSSATSGPAGY